MEEVTNRRERKKLHSRKAIVESAIKIFEEKGYQETSVADIMNDADLGIGTFYNYFESKEEILKSLLSEIIVEINLHFETLLRQDMMVKDMLREMFFLTARILDEKRFVLPLFLSAAHKGTIPKEQMKAKGGLTFKHIFDQIVRAGQDSGEFRSDIPAEVITEMFHSVFQAASFSSLPIGFMENIKYKFTLIMDGISVRQA